MKDLYILKGRDNYYDLIREIGASKRYNRTICKATAIGMRPLLECTSGCFTCRGILLKRKLYDY